MPVHTSVLTTAKPIADKPHPIPCLCGHGTGPLRVYRHWADRSAVPKGNAEGIRWYSLGLASTSGPPSTTRMARLHNAPTHPTRMRASLGSRLRRRSVSSAALRCARHQRRARPAAARPSSHPLAASTAGICIVRIASTLCPRGSPVGSADGPTPDKRTRRMEPTCGDQVLLVTGLCVRVCGREGVCVSDEHSAILSVSEANTQKRAPAVAGGAPFGRARRRRTQRAAGG